MSTRTAGRRFGLVASFVLLAILLLVLTQWQRGLDWLKLRNYQPPAAIVEIVEQTTMTPAARHLFYINHPTLDDKAAFQQNCPDYEQTIVLGCYRQGQRGIHVLKVTDPRLEGVEQVTAAHEMLHAAYDRLGSGERQQVNGWLRDYARDQLSDQRIKDTLKNYETTEPGEQDNEMYAIFGTEIAELPAELERHYSRFFRDRQAVVAFAANYQAAFTSRRQQIDDYDRRLADLKARIDRNTGELASRRDGLAASERQLENHQRSGDVGRYNAGVADYNQRVVGFNGLLEQTKALIAEHNRLVAERNELATQTAELQQAIDSSVLPSQQ